ncbi:uncharacterized protein LOC117642133 isoform X2 [Thrips palmi]|uniref:Uncharacterized protein LOC117642133 isoform X2 n=1 Tax=Thrips palmi TaxID=161013 RepID=A0A6P8YG62_THRPL|nr:uncharacterized protein LOC117642133 isoform X2 [Thrips palmi]
MSEDSSLLVLLHKPTSFMDSFALSESSAHASNDRSVRPLWCVECRAIASADCEDAHTLWGLRRAVRHYAQQVQELADGAAQHLQAACGRVEELLQTHFKAEDALRLLVEPVQCELTLRTSGATFAATLSLAEGLAASGHASEDTVARTLAFAVIASGHLKPMEERGIGDPATSTEEGPSSRLSHSSNMTGSENGSCWSSLDEFALEVKPDLQALAAAMQSSSSTAGEASAGVEGGHVDLYDLSVSPAGFNVQAKQDVLEAISNQTIRSLTRLHCDEDPAWSLEILRRVPRQHLKELDVRYVQWEHLEAVHGALPSLRRLSVSGTQSLACRKDAVEMPCQSGVVRLEASCLPRPALFALIRTHRLTLRELWLGVGTGGRDSIPYSGADLSALLTQCELRAVELVVLQRENCLHVAARCRAQRATVRTALPKQARVLCRRCDAKDFTPAS